MVESKKLPFTPGSADHNRRHRTSEKADEKANGGAIGETDRHQRLPRDDDAAALSTGRQRRLDH